MNICCSQCVCAMFVSVSLLYWWYLWSIWVVRCYKMVTEMICVFTITNVYDTLPSVLWCCWFCGRKGIWPVKKYGGWWRWALVSPDGVSVSASVNLLLHHIYLSILWAGVQPTLDPYAEAFYSRPIALTLGGEEFSVNDVCKCVCDCRVGWAE